MCAPCGEPVTPPGKHLRGQNPCGNVAVGAEGETPALLEELLQLETRARVRTESRRRKRPRGLWLETAPFWLAISQLGRSLRKAELNDSWRRK